MINNKKNKIIKPSLIVMAAGMGSRYGGLKQIDPVGPNGELIIDYSIYDAIKAGFSKIVFIIREEHKEDFDKVIGRRISKFVKIKYAYQSVDDIPKEIKIPFKRKKPWGTTQAVLCAKDYINESFAVINADDFYGRSSFKILSDYLISAKDKDGVFDYCMVGFKLMNTLTDHGYVSRGVCKLDEKGYLKDIIERAKVKRIDGGANYAIDDKKWIEIPKGSIASMNMWGFTQSVFKEFEDRFILFLKGLKEDEEKAECFIPTEVGSILKEHKAKVKALLSNEKWYGITYKEDKEKVKKAIEELVEKGIYPANLWGGNKK